MHVGKLLGPLAAAVVFTFPVWPLAAAKVKDTPEVRAPAPAGGIAASDSAQRPFEGESPGARPEIHYDPATRMVTVEMQIEGPNGRIIPDVRRDNFAVYENGVRQPNVDIEIEHAPVSLALVLQWGGPYESLNQEMYVEIPRAAHQLLNQLERRDQIAIWKYGDRTDEMADFAKGRDTLDSIFLDLNPPEFSEANLYDALVATLRRVQGVAGRKGVVLISMGIDTFSRASYQDALKAARGCGTPIYAINVGPALRAMIGQASAPGGYSQADWNQAARNLQEIARVSGGRLYSPTSTFDLSGIYDDMMENLRIRYVVRYQSPATDSDAPRTVRIDLVNPQTGGPLEVQDAGGKPAPLKFSIEETYEAHGAGVAHTAAAPSPASRE